MYKEILLLENLLSITQGGSETLEFGDIDLPRYGCCDDGHQADWEQVEGNQVKWKESKYVAVLCTPFVWSLRTKLKIFPGKRCSQTWSQLFQSIEYVQSLKIVWFF